ADVCLTGIITTPPITASSRRLKVTDRKINQQHLDRHDTGENNGDRVPVSVECVRQLLARGSMATNHPACLIGSASPDQKHDAATRCHFTQVITSKLITQPLTERRPRPILIEQLELDRNRRSHVFTLNPDIRPLSVRQLVFLSA